MNFRNIINSNCEKLFNLFFKTYFRLLTNISATFYKNLTSVIEYSKNFDKLLLRWSILLLVSIYVGCLTQKLLRLLVLIKFLVSIGDYCLFLVGTLATVMTGASYDFQRILDDLNPVYLLFSWNVHHC